MFIVSRGLDFGKESYTSDLCNISSSENIESSYKVNNSGLDDESFLSSLFEESSEGDLSDLEL